MPRYEKFKNHIFVPTPEDYPYLVWKNKTGKIPFGYKRSEDDPQLLEPIREILDKLYEAYNYRPASSWDQIVRWLTGATGMSLTKQGLMRKYEKEQEKLKEK